jgi:hypothetical protein
MIFDDSNIFFMSGSSSKIHVGRLFLIMLNTSGFWGLCVETYGITLTVFRILSKESCLFF